MICIVGGDVVTRPLRDWNSRIKWSDGRCGARG